MLIATLIDYKYARRNVILFAIAALICTVLLLDINMTLNLHLATEPDPQLALIVDVLKFFVFVIHFFKSGRVYTLFMWLSTIPTSTALISFFLQRLLDASESEVRTLVADYSLMTISYFLLLSGVLIDLGLINKSRTDSEAQSPVKEVSLTCQYDRFILTAINRSHPPRPCKSRKRCRRVRTRHQTVNSRLRSHPLMSRMQCAPKKKHCT